MNFKIEFFYNGGKRKHKLYDTEAAYDKWWQYHSEFNKVMNSRNPLGILGSGLVGLKDGILDKTSGHVAEKYNERD